MKEKRNLLPQVEIYSDGSARGNPGPGGYGTVILFRDSKDTLHRREYSAGYRMTTNNRMELMGAIVGLEKLIRPCQVEFYSDSKYLVDAFELHWVDGWLRKNFRLANKHPVKNIDLWKRLLKAKEPHSVRFHWVKGHAGHPENECCDRLATGASLGDDLAEDTGYQEDGRA